MTWAGPPEGRVRDAGWREPAAADNSEAARKVSDRPQYQFFLEKLIQTNCKHFYGFLGPCINSIGPTFGIQR